MKILISGSSGFIGKALCNRLESNGILVSRLTRKKIDGAPFWDPDKRLIDLGENPQFDGVIHLGGESIADGLWTKQKKERIRSSRVNNTRFLAESILNLKEHPKFFIQASAIGFYGDRGDEILNEKSNNGQGFLADVCREWENASSMLIQTGIRVVKVRIGLVLGKDGGLLQKMLLPFKLGLGAKLGSGTQFMSWISLNDLLRIFEIAIHNEKIEGIVNGVAPNPVTNAMFTKGLAGALKRPAFLPLPAPLLRLLPGEFAEECLLSSTRIMPEKLSNLGFQFDQPELKPALEKILSF